MPKFTVILGGKVLRTFDVDGDIIVIGRHQNADVFIDNPAVSRKHARIYYNHGAYVLEDLNSVNGVFLNGRQVKAHYLTDGDEIQISKFTIRYAAGPPRVERGNAMFMPDLKDGQDTGGFGEQTVYVRPPDTSGAHRAVPSQSQPHLKALGQGRGEVFPLSKKVTVVGKGGEADIPLRGLLAGSRVADIVLVDRTFWLKATSMIQGVKVNGERVREARLKNEDLIQIGDNLFTFKDGASR